MRKRQDIYDGKHKYDDELRRLREADISPLNRETIKRFNDERLAQQLKASTVIKRSAQLRRIAELLGKDFIEVEREDILRLLRIISTAKLKKSAAAYAHPGKVDPSPRELSVAGKKDYWRIIKSFFRWMGMEEVLKDVNPNFRERIEIGPIITEEHLKKAVAATTSVRDKALLWVMHESGARIGELLNVLIRDVTREEYGLRVRLNGKTGERFVLLVKSTPYVLRWLEQHPNAGDPDEFLWVSTHNRFSGSPLKYPGCRRMIKRAFEEAGISDVDNNPHHFRKSRATLHAKHLTEPIMRKYFGWAAGSDQVKHYVNASGRDVDNALLSMYGIKDNDDEEAQGNLPVVCEICGHENSSEASFCSQCGKPMDSAVAAQEEDARFAAEKEKTMQLLEQIMNDPEQMQRFAAFRASQAN